MCREPSSYDLGSPHWAREPPLNQGIESQLSPSTGAQWQGLQLCSHFCLDNSGLSLTRWVTGGCCSDGWSQMVTASYWFSSAGHTFLLWPCCHLYKPQCYLNYWISIKFTLTLGHFLWPLNSTPIAVYQTCSILVYHSHCLSAQGCLNGSLCLSLKMEKNNFVILTLSAWVSIPRVWVPL